MVSLSWAHVTLGTGHPGTQHTYSLLQPKYWWPNMLRDINHFVYHGKDVRHLKFPTLFRLENSCLFLFHPGHGHILQLILFPISQNHMDTVVTLLARNKTVSLQIPNRTAYHAKARAVHFFFSNHHTHSHTLDLQHTVLIKDSCTQSPFIHIDNG